MLGESASDVQLETEQGNPREDGDKETKLLLPFNFVETLKTTLLDEDPDLVTCESC